MLPPPDLGETIMHREHRPPLRIAPLCGYGKSRHGALEAADRHAKRLGILGHVECRGRMEPAPRERSVDLRERLSYAALIAAPLIELASAAGWPALPGAPLLTIAA
jgi:hypothetical protein